MSKKVLPRAILRPLTDRPEPVAKTDAAPAPEFAPVVAVAETGLNDNAPAPPAIALDARELEARRARARAIVKRHTAYAAAGGLVPVPIVNVAGLTAIIVRMVKGLSKLYGMPFERDRTRAVVIGLMGGTMPMGLATVTASTLFAVVPGSNLIGLAVSSATAVACTRSIGAVFVEHFESATSAPGQG
jgi:uncharacterized protein (DUF697 family)